MPPDRRALPKPAPSRESYKIGIICALGKEAIAVQSAFDHCFLKAKEHPTAVDGDNNSYSFGTICDHHVVLARIGGTGNVQAIDVAKDMNRSFPNIKLCLVVGICGIVPQHKDREIFLGDVIVSKDVVYYTKGKHYPTGLRTENMLNGAPKGVVRAFEQLTSPQHWRAFREQVYTDLRALMEDVDIKELKYQYPGREVDFLYNTDYLHAHHDKECAACDAQEYCQEAVDACCQALGCSESQLIRPPHVPHDIALTTTVKASAIANDIVYSDGHRSITPKLDSSCLPQVYVSKIASGDVVLKDGRMRDQVAKDHDVVAFEMEGAGVSYTFPTVVIKAGCDYADSHKKKQWQEWAAMTAASCAKAFIGQVQMGISPNVEYLSENSSVDNAGINEHFRQRVKKLYGREDQLTEIATLFAEDTDRPRIVVLHAMGGQGKTQIALEYCYRAQKIKTYEGMFWVNGNSTLTITQSLVGIAREFDRSIAAALPDDDARVAFVLHTLEEWEHQWLMVFDNCDDAATFSKVEHFIPQVGRGHILFTSRHRGLEELGNVIEVPPLPLQAGVELLLHRYRGINVDDYMSEGTMIVNRLGGLALAIDQASAYMHYVQLPVHQLSTFLPQYLSQREKVLRHTTRNFWKYTKIENPDERQKAVNAFTTWEMSSQQLSDHSEKQSSMAHFLTLSAFLGPTLVNEELFSLYWALTDPTPIWMNIFTLSALKRPGEEESSRGTEHNTAIRSDHISDLSQAVGAIHIPEPEESWSTDHFWDIIYQIYQMSLLQSISPATESAGASFLLHPLIRDWLQLRQALLERQTCIREAVDVMISSIRTYATRHSDAQVKSTLLLHLDTVLHNDHEFFDNEHQVGQQISTCDSAVLFALYYQEQGRYDTSLNLSRAEVETRIRVLGKRHPSTLTSMNNLATVLSRQGKYAEAEQLYREVIQAQKSVLGEEHPNTLTSINNLATVLSSQGKYIEAEQRYQEVIKARESTPGKDHPDTLISIDSLAGVLSSQGKYAEAEQLYQEVIIARERVLGKEHPDTLTSINSLAIVLSREGRYTKAEQLYREVIQVQKRVLVKEHPDILTSIDSLAGVLDDQDKYIEAEQLYREVIRARERVLNREHPRTLTSMNNLATVLSSQGKYTEAEHLYREVVKARERVLGKEHPNTLTSTNNLATVLRDQGKYQEAEQIHRVVVKAQERILVKGHPDVLTSMNNLAGVLSDQGKYTEAEDIQREVFKASSVTLGLQHPCAVIYLDTLLQIWQSQGWQESEVESALTSLLGSMDDV